MLHSCRSHCVRKKIEQKCGFDIIKCQKYYEAPNLMVFNLQGQAIKVNKEIILMHQDKAKTFRLSSMTYFGGFHHISRVMMNMVMYGIMMG
ncbi:MAG: hypothetical protein QOE33_3607 [Acidobacteriota bacterium]|nr:hypothetical protein [Acidobacteriota bacterium]